MDAGLSGVTESQWNSYLAGLQHTTEQQDVGEHPAGGCTFAPGLSCEFVEEVSHKLGEEVTVDHVVAVFYSFWGTQPSSELQQILAVIHRSTDQVHLAVNLAHAYTFQSFFFSSLNSTLRENAREAIGTISPIVRQMMVLPHVRSCTGTFFRGLLISEEQERLHYCPGLVFSWAGFTSCSKSPEVAERFAGGDCGVVFEVAVQDPRVAEEVVADLRGVSYFPNEQEVLLMPYTSLLVTGVRESEEGRRLVRCEVQSSSMQMTGVWDCAEDGGQYFVVHAGPRVAWFGHARPGSGMSWAHIFFGEMDGGGRLRGTYCDVPTARDRFSGEIECGVDLRSMTMTMARSDGVFMGRTWSRRSVAVAAGDRPTLGHVATPGDSGLTGQWTSTGGAQYYVRQVGARLFWFAHAANWTWAHVAESQQEESGGVFLVKYQDIVLSTRFRYTGVVRVQLTPGGDLSIEPVRGPFADRLLTRGR